MKPRDQMQVLRRVGIVDSFSSTLRQKASHPLRATDIQILQINVGKRCNMSCKHCHVEAGPLRREIMPENIFAKCLEIARTFRIPVVDITGGAPEMNPHLAWFISQASRLGCRLIVRSNLTVLADSRYAHFADVFAENKVEIAASLPDYHPDKSDRQRGSKAFEIAVGIIRKLNQRGYGRGGTGLILDLVHNPVGAYLPGSQQALEEEYRRNLKTKHGIVFNHLFSLTNCPIGRYLDYLLRTDNLEDYMSELAGAFNPSAADHVMCRTTLSVGWDGMLYDCDFNQMLDMPVDHGAPDHIDRFDFDMLKTREIMIDNHCYCCTAGSGSSCQGSTA